MYHAKRVNKQSNEQLACRHPSALQPILVKSLMARKLCHPCKEFDTEADLTVSCKIPGLDLDTEWVKDPAVERNQARIAFVEAHSCFDYTIS